MINKHKFCYLVLVSVAMILMLVNIVGADPLKYVPNPTNNTSICN